MVGEVYPLRVINVRDTLAFARGVCFSVPKDWNFHVISHTWSLKVREWSEEVASKIADGGRDNEVFRNHDNVAFQNRYNEVFQNEDFRGRPYYTYFLQFLEILQIDGVEKVWFDALCINQSDMDEKSREIMQMGSFYSKSQGCYVLAHGLGQGFEALSKDGSLPRWFSRVWTIQEFLLPKELWFIVELDEDILEKVNFRPHEYCRKVPPLSSDNDLLHSSHLYFLNRESYESVLGSKIIGPQSKQEVMDHLLAFWEFSALRSSIDQPDKVKFTCCITKEVEFRDCSEGHEEDRLLSILGLLGVDPRQMSQLRVGKSLEEQILDLLSQLIKVDQHLLLALCASSMLSYPRRGMSWCPRLMRSQDAYMSNPPFLAAAADTTKVIDVSERGLKLSCRFLRAQCLSFEAHKRRCTDALHCMSCTFDAKRVVEKDGQAPFGNFRLKWVFNIEVGEASVITFPMLHVSHEGVLIFYVNPFESSYNNPRLISGPNSGNAVENSGLVLNLGNTILTHDDPYKALPHFYSWLLLIGYHLSHEDEDHTHSTSSFLFMVCIGTNPHHLHKVGLIQVKERNFGPGWEMLHSWYYDRPSQVGAFTIGGFGDQISLSDLGNSVCSQ